MRVIWLVLAACAGRGSPPPPASPVPASAPTATVPAAPPTHVRARVGLEQGSWTDIAVEGTDEMAVFMCRKLVDRELGPLRVLNVRVLRDCSVEPLPPPTRSPVQLVAFEPVTFDDVLLLAAVDGQSPIDTSAYPRGTVHRVAPFDDRVACEAMLVQLEAAEQRERIETQQATAKHLDEELRRAIASQDTACKDARDAERRCVKLRGVERGSCGVDARAKQRDCDRYTQQRQVLEERRATPVAPEPSSVQRTCRVP